ncbi:MAG: T9SS type A sorting domain-containing protein [Bacteroidales bacterium]|nr:T9SS type A sorting domain-containing protein [Bacteroidales bacterium]
MKKLTLIVLLFTVFSLKAQIVLDANDFPAPSLLRTYHGVTDSSGSLNSIVSLGNAGANGVYTLGNIASLATEVSTTSCLSPSATPFAAQHTNSDMALYWRTFFIMGDTCAWLWTYYDLNANSVLLNGVSAIVDTSYFMNLQHGPHVSYTPPLSKNLEMLSTNYALGYTYKDSATSNIYMDLQWPLVVAAKLTIDVNVDGWGTLTTPIGNYQVLRVKQIWKQADDFIQPDDTLGVIQYPEYEIYHQYIFYAKHIGTPVAYVTMDSTFTNIVGVKYTDYIYTSINENQSNNLVVTGDNSSFLKIWNPDNTCDFDLKIYDISGKEILIQYNLSDYEININTEHFNAGVYLICLSNNNSVYRSKYLIR